MIRDYLGPWGFMIVLAPKPHQETVSTINKCVWRLCASYHALNAVTIFLLLQVHVVARVLRTSEIPKVQYSTSN